MEFSILLERYQLMLQFPVMLPHLPHHFVGIRPAPSGKYHDILGVNDVSFPDVHLVSSFDFQTALYSGAVHY